MISLKHKPHNLLLLSGVALIFVFILLKLIKIEVADTAVLFLPLIPTVLILYWLLYLMTQGFMYSKSVMLSHIILTIVTAFFLVVIIYIGIDPLNPEARRYYDGDQIDNYGWFTRAIRMLLLILLSGQMLYIINLVNGILATDAKQTKSPE